MRKLYSLETPVIYKKRQYIIQTIELCMPVPIFKNTETNFAYRSERMLRYECLLIKVSDSGHPNFAKARLIERHETKDEAIHQHWRLKDDINRGRSIFDHKSSRYRLDDETNQYAVIKDDHGYAKGLWAVIPES